MKLLFVGEGDVHLGCLEMDGDSVVIKKYKPEFDPQVIDAPEEDDMDDMGAVQEEANEMDEEMEEEESEVETPMGKMSKPKKFKGGKGMF